MRILKDKTVPLSCRVSEEMKYQIEAMADTLELSLAQYVGILVDIGQNGEAGLKKLKERLATANEKQLEIQIELKKLSPFQSTAFAKPLASLVENEHILEDLYEQYRSIPFDRNLLSTIGFQFNIMLQAKSIEKSTFYFMGNYGWAYTDRERKTVTIRKSI